MKFIKTFQNSFQIYEKTFDNYILSSKLDEELDKDISRIPDIMKQVNERKQYDNYIAPSKLDGELDDEVVYRVTDKQQFMDYEPNNALFKNFDYEFFESMKDERDIIKEGDWVLLSFGAGTLDMNNNLSTYLCKMDKAFYRSIHEYELGRSFTYISDDNEAEIIYGRKCTKIYYGLNDSNHAIKYSSYINQLAGIPDIMKQVNEENHVDIDFIPPSKLDEKLNSDKIYIIHEMGSDIHKSVETGAFDDADVVLFRNFKMKFLTNTKDEKNSVKIGDWVIATYFEGGYNTYLFKIQETDSVGDIGMSYGSTYYAVEMSHHIITYSSYINQMAGTYDVLKTINERNFMSIYDLNKELDTKLMYNLHGGSDNKNNIFDHFDNELFLNMSDERDDIELGDWIIMSYRGDYGPTELMNVNSLGEEIKVGEYYYNIENAEHIVKYSSYINRLAGIPDIMKTINEYNEDITWYNYLPQSQLDIELDQNIFYHVNPQNEERLDLTKHKNLYIPNLSIHFIESLEDERHLIKRGDWVFSLYESTNTLTFTKIKISESGMLGVSNGNGIMEIPNGFKVVRYKSFISQLAGVPNILKTINENMKFIPPSQLDEELDEEHVYGSDEIEKILPGIDVNFLLKIPDEQDTMKESDWIIVTYEQFPSDRYYTYLFKVEKFDNGSFGKEEIIGVDGEYYSIDSDDHVVKYSTYINELAGVPNIMKDINETTSHDKMKSYVDYTLGKYKGGEEYFDIIDKIIKDPNNLDIIKDVFKEIKQDFGDNFNIILTGGFGDRVKYLIDKKILSVPGNIVQISGALRDKYKNKVDVIYKKHHIDNQDFILFDDSFYSGSTKRKIDDYLKGFNSKIIQTYVVYDGSREKQKGLKHIYRYRDHHQGTIIPVEKLIEIIDRQELPKELYNKVTDGTIKTYDQLVKYVKKFNKDIQSLSYREERDI